MTLLAADELTVEIGGKRVVDGVGFTIDAGATLGLVGESGSGKTMTALAIAGLLPPAARGLGRVRFGRAVLDAGKPGDWDGLRGARIGFVFQDPYTSFDPLDAVGAQIALASGLPAAQARERAIELLAECGLPNPAAAARAYPHQLSGGQLQRAAIAAALAGGPDLLIADEPTTALDMTVQAQVLALLRRLQATLGMAMLFVSHDLAVVGALARDVAVMRAGAIVERGPASRILTRPEHPYTRTLLDARPAGKLPGIEPPAIAAAALETSDLRYVHPARRRGMKPTLALDGVDLRVGNGECVGLVGESGSGKSTFARLAIGLVRPSAGAVRLFGNDPADRRHAKATARRAQMVFQDASGSLNPRLTVEAAMIEPFALHGVGTRAERRERAAGLLAEVGLEQAHLARYPHELSGGQRQRVAIARALALDPALLVCDEPVTALDMTIQAQILALLRRIRDKRGLSMLFVSHDIGAIETLADRVAVLKDGKLVEEGPAARVLRAPTAEHTRALLAAIPRLESAAAPAADPVPA
ncbi:MAG: ABC transporter ATP-binding protein [Azospirillum sp.]|nr:ABC transporter ATP-binding protein [Azospirillum sp.]MCA3267979.1 ABC transporter ATP-binding protein [Azospirillum sp.]